ncbi:MAG TPA: N-acetyltransferase [Actinospica sp.]|nr:N-acetyltransferase [Actinospica sp.]
MTDRPFVPEDFVVPTELVTARFRLEPLGPQHNAADHAAWTGSIEHISSTPGLPGWGWPPAEGMSLEANRADLERHAADFVQRRGFTYTVLDIPDGTVIGCVYIYPSRTDDYDATVRSWVSAANADLDKPLYTAVSEWLATEWPLGAVKYAPRA